MDYDVRLKRGKDPFVIFGSCGIKFRVRKTEVVAPSRTATRGKQLVPALSEVEQRLSKEAVGSRN
jgi:hypothetical protein